MKKGIKNFGILLAVFVMFLSGCNPGSKKAAQKEENPGEEVASLVESDYFLIGENEIKSPHVEDVDPVTIKAEKESKPQQHKPETKKKNDEGEFVVVIADLTAAIEPYGYVPAEEVVETDSWAVPLDETQTLVAFSKKGKEKADLQVITDLQTGEVQQIVFADKKHKDVYNVQAGMSSKEVKKLRKDLKVMKRKGKVYLYDDSSNIMYLLDVEDSEGDEITESQVDTVDVRAIVWEDKRHHKKD